MVRVVVFIWVGFVVVIVVVVAAAAAVVAVCLFVLPSVAFSLWNIFDLCNFIVFVELVHPASYTMGSVDSLTGLERLGREAGSSPPSTAKTKNA
jgi:hypothetical protein